MTVGLHAGEEDVEEPQAKEEGWGHEAVTSGPAQLAADVRPPPVQEHADGHEGEDGVERHREGQPAGGHHKLAPMPLVVDGRHRPGHADAQEDIDRVAARHVADGGVGVAVLHGGHLAGKCVCGRRGREKALQKGGERERRNKRKRKKSCERGEEREGDKHVWRIWWKKREKTQREDK